MAFLTGAKLASHLAMLRMQNKLGTISAFNVFHGIGRKSSLRRRHQNATYGERPGSGEQECYRRKIGGFYGVRKHEIFK